MRQDHGSPAPLRRHVLLGGPAALTAGLACQLWAQTGETQASLKPRGELSILDFGAQPGGETLCTRAIQSAIDRCSEHGGGTVIIPPGRFLTGTLVLRSHVRLYLAPGAYLIGSKKLDDYPIHRPSYRSYTDNYTERSLIYAEKNRKR